MVRQRQPKTSQALIQARGGAALFDLHANEHVCQTDVRSCELKDARRVQVVEQSLRSPLTHHEQAPGIQYKGPVGRSEKEGEAR